MSHERVRGRERSCEELEPTFPERERRHRGRRRERRNDQTSATQTAQNARRRVPVRWSRTPQPAAGPRIKALEGRVRQQVLPAHRQERGKHQRSSLRRGPGLYLRSGHERGHPPLRGGGGQGSFAGAPALPRGSRGRAIARDHRGPQQVQAGRHHLRPLPLGGRHRGVPPRHPLRLHRKYFPSLSSLSRHRTDLSLSFSLSLLRRSPCRT